MKKINTIFLTGLLALSVSTTIMGCGKKSEESESKPHEHQYVFDHFIWTETPGAYTAKARLKCEADTAVKEVDADVMKVTTVTNTCKLDGKYVWKATYGEHEETKEEFLPATGIHTHTADEKEYTDVSGVTYYECDSCGDKIFHFTYSDREYYFMFEEKSAPTATEDGKIAVRFFDYTSAEKKFTPHVHVDEENDPRSAEIIVGSFIEYGNHYSINTEESKLTYTSYINLLTKENRDAMSLNLTTSMSVAKTIFAEMVKVYAVNNLTALLPEMKYEVNICAGESWGGGKYGPSTVLTTYKAARKDGAVLPYDGDPIGRAGYKLAGFSTSAGGAVSNVAGDTIEIPNNQLGAITRYCVWVETTKAGQIINTKDGDAFVEFDNSDKAPTQTYYETPFLLKGFDRNKNATSATYSAGATLSFATYTTLFAIWGDPIFAVKPTSASFITGRGAVARLTVAGESIKTGDEVFVRLKDGTIKASLISGIATISPTTVVDEAAVGDTVDVLLRGIEKDSFSNETIFIWKKH